MRVTQYGQRLAIGLLSLAVVAVACSVDVGGGDGAPDLSGQPEVEAPTGADIAFGDVSAGVVINPLLFGTNVPAWVNPTRTQEPWFAQAVAESGTTLLRFPGGSWSNHYDWRACMDGADGCFWTWALAPQDYARVIVDTGLPAIWTASINSTAEASAALVAFFNGSVDDAQVIGVDRDGVDWLTVGHWAERRAAYGFEEPVPIDYWEIGNEVYGAVAAAGPDCAEFGWEEVWTCDGAEYMTGARGNDGFNAVASAMRSVDPTIQIGAVGVSPVDSWGDFGNEVLAAGADTIDFYVVHTYAFGGPFEATDVLGAHTDIDWPGTVADIDLAAAAVGYPAAPTIAVTEYNLVAWQDADDQALMTTMYNLFHLVGALGEMAAAEIDIATQWALLSGLQPSGTDYGVIDGDTQTLYPSFFALRLWAAMGDRLIPVSDHPQLTEYAAVDDDGTVSLLVANPSADAVAITIATPTTGANVLLDVVTADALESRTVSYNGHPIATLDDLVGVGPLDQGSVRGTWEYEVPAFSIVKLRFESAG